MQEEVENRTLTLVVSGTKFTGRMFKAAISKYMAHRKEKKLEKQRSRDAPVVPHGKQTVPLKMKPSLLPISRASGMKTRARTQTADSGNWKKPESAWQNWTP